MIDPIDLANKVTELQKSAKETSVDKIKSLVTSVAARQQVSVPFQGNLIPSLKKLPTVKDTKLVQRQLEAAQHSIQVEVDRKISEGKELAVETAKQKISQFKSGIPRLPSIPKAALSDPKILAEFTYSQLKKKVIAEKQKISKKNLKTSSEIFKFPIQPKNVDIKLPTIPDIPIVKTVDRVINTVNNER